VALGNSGDAKALPALRQAAADPEPLISMHAGWAIRQIERQKTGSSGKFVLFIASAGMTWGHGRDIIA
jgi:3-methyladenine DNA glycosylase AlkD